MCCDTECTKRGEACDRAGSRGTCTSVPVLHVDPISGNDQFKGLESAPLRVAAVVASSASPWRVVLHDGTYSAASGEAWPASARSGAKVEALNPGKAVLSGAGTGVAVILEGDVSVTGVVAKNFGVAFLGGIGPLDLSRLEIDGGGGFVFTNGVKAKLRDTNLRNLTGIGVEVKEKAVVEMTGGSVVRDALATSCDKAVGLQVGTDGALTLGSVHVSGFQSAGLLLGRGFADVADSTFDANGLPECEGAQAKVLEGGLPTFTGVHMVNGKTSGIDAGGLAAEYVKLTDSTLTGNRVGVMLRGDRTLNMEHSKITGSFIGIYAPTADDRVVLDMGEVPHEGNNVVQGTNHAMVLMGAYDPLIVMLVYGNQWNPNVGGADADGRYVGINNSVRTRPQEPAGGNFFAPNVKLDL